MIVHTRVPAPPLSDFVALLWLSEGGEGTHPRERILPTGTAEIVVALDDVPMPVWERTDLVRGRDFRGALVCGPHAGFFVIDNPARARFAGIHFRPGGAPPFLRLPAGEVCETHVPLDDLWGAAAAELRERLMGASGAEACFDEMEAFLLRRLAAGTARHVGVRAALRAFGAGGAATATVGEVVERVGMSHRAFAARFRAEVGLPPKLYCRVQRFQEVVRRVASGPPLAWSRLALDCGYYDQAHFIHDFRAFSGLTPAEYASRRGDHANHVALPD